MARYFWRDCRCQPITQVPFWFLHMSALRLVTASPSQMDGGRDTHPAPVTLPSEVSLNLSLLFFFLHFQGLKILPKLENLLFLFVGGVVSPDSKTSTPMLASLGA